MRIGKFVFGLALICTGLVYLLDQMDLVRARDLYHFWPMFLVLAGFLKTIFPGHSSRLTGVMLFLVGCWLQLEELGLLPRTFWKFWPAIFVLIGLRIVWRSVFGPSNGRPFEATSDVTSIAILGGSKRINNSQDFRSADCFALMGGSELNLRGARIANPPAVIDAVAVMGGVEIKVPDDWVVSLNGLPLLGGFEDETRGDETLQGEPRQELVVKGFAVFGGVAVKN